MLGKVLTHKHTGEVIQVSGEEGKGAAKQYVILYIQSKTNKQPFKITPKDLEKMLVYDRWMVS